MDAITIPLREPLTFRSLRELNPAASVEALAEAFDRLPHELKEEAWQQLRLRVGLDYWNAQAVETHLTAGA